MGYTRNEPGEETRSIEFCTRKKISAVFVVIWRDFLLRPAFGQSIWVIVWVSMSGYDASNLVPVNWRATLLRQNFEFYKAHARGWIVCLYVLWSPGILPVLVENRL